MHPHARGSQPQQASTVTGLDTYTLGRQPNITWNVRLWSIPYYKCIPACKL